MAAPVVMDPTLEPQSYFTNGERAATDLLPAPTMCLAAEYAPATWIGTLTRCSDEIRAIGSYTMDTHPTHNNIYVARW